MIQKQTWEEFQKTGLLWWINRTLHLFGYSIIYEYDNGALKEVYPAKVPYRGFPKTDEAINFNTLTNYVKDNINQLAEQTKLNEAIHLLKDD